MTLNTYYCALNFEIAWEVKVQGQIKSMFKESRENCGSRRYTMQKIRVENFQSFTARKPLE